MPIDPSRSPLTDAMFSGTSTQQFQEMSNDDIVQLQKEQENRLIGSMMMTQQRGPAAPLTRTSGLFVSVSWSGPR